MPEPERADEREQEPDLPLLVIQPAGSYDVTYTRKPGRDCGQCKGMAFRRPCCARRSQQQ